jgi:DNA invertase Pin-like site-specific DNA recombinase
VLYYTRKEFIEQYGGCYRTVNRIADREGFTFKDPDRSVNYKRSKRTEQNLEKIAEILKAGSATYKEIGDALGISRQRAEQIIKKHGIYKQAKYRGQSMKTVEKIVYALDHLPCGRNISATAFAKEAGVDYASLMRFVNRLDADDKRAVAFNDCFRKYEPVKADKIRELLKTTDLSCTEIARHMGSPISYVSRINRNENIRHSNRKNKKEEK